MSDRTAARLRIGALGFVLVLVVSAFGTTASAAANRAPGAPSIHSPSQSVEGVRYSNRNAMSLWASTTDPDRQLVSYRFRIFLFGSAANLYDSGWRREATRGWGVSVSVPSGAPIPPGMTYVLAVQARDPNLARSREVAVSYSVFSNSGNDVGTQSVGWYHDTVDLNVSPHPLSHWNSGLSVPSEGFMNSKLPDLFSPGTANCRSLPPALANQMLTRNVGLLGHSPRLLGPAMNSLQTVIREVLVKEPVLYYILRLNGSQCWRNKKQNGSIVPGTISNHSWGSALDFQSSQQGVQEDPPGRQVTRYLVRLWRWMHPAGWTWGGAYGHQDNMHFETSTRLLDYWAFLGLIRD